MDNLSPPPPEPNPPPLPSQPYAPPRINPPPRPRRRSSGWIIAIIVMTGLALLAIPLLMVFQVFASLSLSGPGTAMTVQPLQEVVTEENRSRHKVAMVDLKGMISSGSYDRSGFNLVRYIRQQFELAEEDPRVRAVVLLIDSPGGEVLASDEIFEAITEFQDRSGKPVVAAMQSLAASGGYYAAAPCTWIVAHELTLTGSIGVIIHAYNYRGLMDKVGVAPQVYKSGRFKDMLSGDRLEATITPEEREMVQALVDEAFTRFKSVIRTGRTAAAEANDRTGRPLADNWEEYADGRILSGSQAYEHGFVDELGTTETAINRALQLAGIGNANLIRYQRPFQLGNLFRLLGEAPDPGAATVKIDLGMDLPQLRAGHLYFLAPPLIQ